MENLLSVRESLFSVRPNDRHFPPVSGETVFGLRAWDVAALERTLETELLGKNLVPGIELLGPAIGFTPGEFIRLRVDLELPAKFFPQPRIHLEEYLRGAYVRYSVRRESTGYRFDLPPKALKKKILLGGSFETRVEDRGFHSSLEVGPKFDLLAFLGTFGGQDLVCQARVRVSEVKW